MDSEKNENRSGSYHVGFYFGKIIKFALFASFIGMILVRVLKG